MTSIKKHPEYKKEADRLEYTKDYFNKFVENIEENSKNYQSEIREAFVNLDYLDSSQSYITILTNAKFLDVNKENLTKVLSAKDKPYFSRIDFQEQGTNGKKKYYIGKLSLLKEDQEPLIVDWRAPVASIYYDGRLGEVSYQTDTTTIKGNLSLKRQYTIDAGKLLDFFDVDITTNDDFLQASLGAHAENRLKDIVATIQAEQNKIIRADLEKPLIVQGVAGSGKTTIALHRVAYLIYTYEDSFIPENFMIMAPNSLFLNYISEVLPELGVERVKQTTYIDFCYELLGLKYKLTKPEEKLILLLEAEQKGNNDEAELIRWAAAFKGSLEFKAIIDAYIADAEQTMLPQEDFALEEYIITSRQNIERQFIHEYSYSPILKRLEQLKNNLSLKLRTHKKKIIEDIEKDYEQKIEAIRSSMEETEERREKIVALMDEREEKLGRVNKAARTLVTKYLAKFFKKPLLVYYDELVSKPEALRKYSASDLDPQAVEHLCMVSSQLLQKKTLELEDLAPLLYLKAKLEGFNNDIKVNNVVIDEAQDFSLFQFFVLKHILKTNSFTILGDLSQGIHAYRGIDNWQEVQDYVFPADATYLTLKQSYRTTIEIMNLANEVLKKGLKREVVLAEPVVRHGDQPELKAFSKESQLTAELSQQISILKRSGYKSIALIGKTMDECQHIKKSLAKEGITVPILTGDETSYEVGVMLVPSYLAKGLEFDAVLIININSSYMVDELDTKLLYVAITRAMHKLSIYYMKGTIHLL
ncbi:MAG: RNA polymerase recycling motor HelD [Bacillota bacterium]|nr:RNA polymerase recycling motor HelD [Bacillota bacterium]